MNKCTHPRTIQHGRDRGFTGSVAVHPYTDENRAAHGGITRVYECTDCGARRRANINGCHTEYGTWGETAAERDARRRALQAAARDAAPPPISLVSDTGGRVTVSLDGEGMIVIRGPHRDERVVLSGLPEDWLVAAQDARRAVIQAQRVDA